MLRYAFTQLAVWLRPLHKDGLPPAICRNNTI